MSASFKETNLQRYTADLASLFRSAIEKGGVKYEVIMDGRHQSVWVDRDMWEVFSYPCTDPRKSSLILLETRSNSRYPDIST